MCAVILRRPCAGLNHAAQHTQESQSSMLARGVGGLSSSLECHRYWNILFSTQLSGCISQKPHPKYLHNAAKAKDIPTQTRSTHAKPQPTHISTQPKSTIPHINSHEKDAEIKITPQQAGKTNNTEQNNTKINNKNKTSDNQTSSQPPLSVVEIDEDTIVRYRPNPSVPPKRVPFNEFLV